MKLFFLFFFLIFLMGCSSYNIEQKELKQETEFLQIKLSSGEIKQIGLEEYVIGVVAGEMPASFHEEALKSQAVAARTYAYYRQESIIEITDFNQVYINEEQMKDKWGTLFVNYYNKVYDAVYDTRDLVILHNGYVIDALYFSISNGKTDSAYDVYHNDVLYLQSVNSEWDKLFEIYKDSKTIKIDDFKRVLNVEDTSFQILEYSVGNSVKSIKIGDKIFDGVFVKEKLGLRSTDFTYKLTNDVLVFETKGYGHQVGMSQWGSYAMALEGYTFEDIIKHYYKDVNIYSINYLQ